MKMFVRGWSRVMTTQIAFDYPVAKSEDRHDDVIMPLGSTNHVPGGIQIGFMKTQLALTPGGKYLIAIVLTDDDLRTLVKRRFGDDARIVAPAERGEDVLSPAP